MSTDTTLEANKQLVQEMSDAIWAKGGSPEAVDDYFAQDFISHEPGHTIEGLEAYKANEQELRTAMPDLDGELDLVLAEDDMVTVHYTATGTHEGEFQGIPATGKSAEITGIAIYRIDDGKVVEGWHEFDMLGMLQQVGVIPENPAA